MQFATALLTYVLDVIFCNNIVSEEPNNVSKLWQKASLGLLLSVSWSKLCRTIINGSTGLDCFNDRLDRFGFLHKTL